MSGFLGFIFVIAATLFFSYIFDIFKAHKFRRHFPLMGAIFLTLILVLLFFMDPYYSPGLSEFSLGHLFLLLPLVILAPLPYIEQWTGTLLQKRYIFFCAVLTTDIFVFFYGIQSAGRFLSGHYWQIEGLVWTLCMVIPAGILFFSFCLLERYLSRNMVNSLSSPPGKESARLVTLTMKEGIIVLIAGILIFWGSFILADHLYDESCGGFEIAVINQSGISDNTVMHLTEQDFQNFPRMGYFIRSAGTLSGTCYGSWPEGDSCIGMGYFRCREGYQFNHYANSILEYHGTYYRMKQTSIV
jgi:hypothetical protein